VKPEEKKIDPWWAKHFFRPLLWLQETAEALGVQPTKIGTAYLARSFALRLRDCRDQHSARALISRESRNAAHFLGIAALEAIGLALQTPASNTVLAPQDGKPFAAIANHLIAVIETKQRSGPGPGDSCNN
jgi:hypothetical protein